MRKYIVNNHYYITRMKQIYINKDTNSLKCIGYVLGQEEFKRKVNDSFDSCIDKMDKGIYWANTHGFFVKILENNPNVKVLFKFKCFKRDISGLLRYWSCPECINCPKRTSCYIVELKEKGDKEIDVKKKNIFIVFKRK